MINRFKKNRFVKFFASPRLTTYCLIVLAILTVWGTLYQAENGLFAAKETFFNSWFIFVLGFIPFPGGALVMTVLTVNLISAMLFRIPFRLKNAGNILTHTGLLILLIGGFITFLYSQESILHLREGEDSRFTTAYHDWELAVWRGVSGERQVYALDSGNFRSGKRVSLSDLKLQIEIEEYHTNCSGFTASDTSGQQAPFNTSGITFLREKKYEMEPTENVPGLIFSTSTDSGTAARVLLYGNDRGPSSLELDGSRYTFNLRKKRYLLPMKIKLIDFEREFYPGSDIPKSFSSRVAVTHEELEREVVISMNKPLRLSGFTFYQQSYYIGQGGVEYSNLAVVNNWGRLLPYISSLVIFFGMTLHFILMLLRRRSGAHPGEPQ